MVKYFIPILLIFQTFFFNLATFAVEILIYNTAMHVYFTVIHQEIIDTTIILIVDSVFFPIYLSKNTALA